MNLKLQKEKLTNCLHVALCETEFRSNKWSVYLFYIINERIKIMF